MPFLYSIIITICAFFASSADISAQTNSQDQLTIMSFNIRRDGPEKENKNRWPNRQHQVVEIIKNNAPDIIGLQEATPNQVTALAAALPDYHLVGKGRGSHYFGRSKNEHTAIAFNTNRFTLQDHGTFVISQGTKNPFKWKSKGKVPRIATWVLLYDKCAQRTVCLYNTHLDHDYGKVQLTGLSNMVADIQKRGFLPKNIPVIITGDFNTPLTQSVLTILAPIATVNTKNSAQSVTGPAATFAGWRGSGTRTIDHILIAGNNRHFNVLQHAVLQEPNSNKRPSDHRPVVVTLQYK